MKTEFQKCMDGEIFDGKDKELAEMTLKTKRLLVKLNSTDLPIRNKKKPSYGRCSGIWEKSPCRHRLSLRIRKKYIRRQ